MSEEQRVRLVIVEDEKPQQMLLEAIFSPLYDVVITDDPIRAYSLIINDRADLLLTDVKLKGEDSGLELIADSKREKNIPAIAVSGNIDAEITAKNAGADLVISKPYEINTLTDSVEKLLRNYNIHVPDYSRVG